MCCLGKVGDEYPLKRIPMNPLRLSIAMCTYNGERFIQEQLDSIRAQTRLPDELIVCDDASTDRTREIVERFGATAPFPVRLRVNNSNMGLGRNFEQAVSLSTGDVIFIADQDDVWHPEKLARFAQEFHRQPGVGLVFSDAEVVDDQLNPKGYRLWRNFGFGLEDQMAVAKGRGFEVLIKHSFVAGATMAFRSDYKELVLPIPSSWLYDAWISTLVSAVSRVAILPEPMNQHRQHPTQVMGARKKSLVYKYKDAKRVVNAEFFTQMAQRNDTARSRLIDFDPHLKEQPEIRAFDEKIALCRLRAKMRQRPILKLPLIAQALLRGRYHRWGHGWKTALLDLFV